MLDWRSDLLRVEVANGFNADAVACNMEDSERIRQYVISRANSDKELALAEQPSTRAEE